MTPKQLATLVVPAALVIGASIYAIKDSERIQHWLWPSTQRPIVPVPRPTEPQPLPPPVETQPEPLPPPVETQPVQPIEVQPLPPPTETTRQPKITKPSQPSKRRPNRKLNENVVVGWSLPLSCEKIRWAVISFSKEKLERLELTSEQRRQIAECLARK